MRRFFRWLYAIHDVRKSNRMMADAVVRYSERNGR